MRRMFLTTLLVLGACAPAMSEQRMVNRLLQDHDWMARCDDRRPDPRREGDVLCAYRRMVKLTPQEQAQRDSAMLACRAQPDCTVPKLPFHLADLYVVQNDSARVRYEPVYVDSVVPVLRDSTVP